MRNLGWGFFAGAAIAGGFSPSIIVGYVLVALPPAAVLAGLFFPVRSAHLSHRQKIGGTIFGAFGCIAMVAYGYWLWAWSGLGGLPYANRFNSTIAEADRVVIRNGGFDCRVTDIDAQTVLLMLTNRVEIAEFNRRIAFRGSLSNCKCNGYPGVDWWKGDECLAQTSIMHGRALRWKCFPKDVGLTPSSSRLLREWFKTHCEIEF